MKGRIVVAAALAAAAIFILAVALWQPWSPSHKAQLLALTSPDALSAFQYYFPAFHAGPGEPAVQDINDSGRFLNFGYCNISCYKVPFTTARDIVGVYYFALVDVDRGRVMAWDSCDYHVTPMGGHATLPPASCWYHEIGGSPEPRMSVSFLPADGRMEFQVLDRESLLSFLNGGQFAEAGLNLDGKTVTPCQAMPLASGSMLTVAGHRYVVIRSLETDREIELEYQIMPS